ncbi:MAG: SAM-dependent chlorinase/fluorinase [Thermodesulfovibrionales bacterium]
MARGDAPSDAARGEVRPALITLTTDFGHKDPFVGEMKGVILSINPLARVVDITHGVGPHDVAEAALVIGDSHGYFPRATVHVVVVDPGVGSGRRPILAEADGHFFVGPDNGVFTEVLRAAGARPRLWHIREERYFLRKGGPTFHGRDVFAPVAAWLSRGTAPEDFGPEVRQWAEIHLPVPEASEDGVSGEVALIDRFGNAITNIREKDLGRLQGGGPVRVLVKGRELSLKGFYSEAGDREPHALVNSNGRLEVFVYMGSAAAELDIKRGDKVFVAGP